LTWLVNFLAGAAGQWKQNESRGVFINRWKICDCDLFICLFRWHTHLKGMDSLWWSICYGRAIQAVEGASDSLPCHIFGRDGINICHGWLKFLLLDRLT
jgi:hypothetical protein